MTKNRRTILGSARYDLLPIHRGIPMPKPRLRRNLLALVPILAGGLLLMGSGRQGGTAAGSGKTLAKKGLPFKVPPGFIVEKVGGAPLVKHPTMGCFDEHGRLFLAET